MKALILAAGIGSRLGALTRHKPKPLLDIGGITIVDYQITQLLNIAKLKFSDIFIIGGHKIETFGYLEDIGVNLIFNPKYREYNNIYSFYLAKDHIRDSFILINGDTLFHPEILRRLIRRGEGTYFAIDNIKQLGDEEMKVLIENDRILKFGKDINPKSAHGEYIGLAMFRLDDAKLIFDKIAELIRIGKTDIWYELAINYVLDKIVARPVYTGGLPWIEVDTPEDYIKARAIFKKVVTVDV